MHFTGTVPGNGLYNIFLSTILNYRMSIKYQRAMFLKKFPVLVSFSLLSFILNAQQTDSLFKSSVLTPVNSFTGGVEGPAVDKAGNLYAVNFDHEGTIGKVTPSGDRSIFVELPVGSIGNGIRFNSHGDMLIADYTKHNVLKVDMKTKDITVFANEPKMNQPNDIAIDKNDCLFASDPNWKDGTGALWFINKKGKVILLERNMGTTNGIEVSPDNKKLYVNESVQRKVWAYDLSKKGTVSNKKLLIEFPDFGMDGMRCDVTGNLYIARHGKGTVAIVSPSGTLLHEVALTGKKPSNIAFGGIDGRSVYITLQDQGNIETFRSDTPGREWKMQGKK
jgi:sugar lactone lactonase YvrE